jgi:hypothetical protein
VAIEELEEELQCCYLLDSLAEGKTVACSSVDKIIRINGYFR